jgi:hypothetical protein
MEGQRPVETAIEAANLLEQSEGTDAAIAFLVAAVRAAGTSGAGASAARLAHEGLNLVGERRDLAWAIFMTWRLNELDGLAGMPLERPERREITRILLSTPAADRPLFVLLAHESRASVLADSNPLARYNLGGLALASLPEFERAAVQFEQEGRIGGAITFGVSAVHSKAFLGRLREAQEDFGRYFALTSRLVESSQPNLQILAAYDDLNMLRGEVEAAGLAIVDRLLAQQESLPYRALVSAAAARISAWLGKTDEALRHLSALPDPIERWDGSAGMYWKLICEAAFAIWLLGRTDSSEVIERNLRRKVIAPDFRSPLHDGRMALARICALTGRFDEAREWFAESRRWLSEEGGLPGLAVNDFDEGWMYLRWPEAGGRERARPLLEASLGPFREIGMTGWQRRAEEMLAEL